MKNLGENSDKNLDAVLKSKTTLDDVISEDISKLEEIKKSLGSSSPEEIDKLIMDYMRGNVDLGDADGEIQILDEGTLKVLNEDKYIVKDMQEDYHKLYKQAGLNNIDGKERKLSIWTRVINALSRNKRSQLERELDSTPDREKIKATLELLSTMLKNGVPAYSRMYEFHTLMIKKWNKTSKEKLLLEEILSINDRIPAKTAEMLKIREKSLGMRESEFMIEASNLKRDVESLKWWISGTIELHKTYKSRMELALASSLTGDIIDGGAGITIAVQEILGQALVKTTKRSINTSRKVDKLVSQEKSKLAIEEASKLIQEFKTENKDRAEKIIKSMEVDSSLVDVIDLEYLKKQIPELKEYEGLLKAN